MNLDQIVDDHSPENLENLFQAKHIAERPFYSILVKETTIPWILFIPKGCLDNNDVVLNLYPQLHKLAAALQEQGYGHYNIAKIGNKNKWLHLHLVFRSEEDEAWPDPIWCHEPLTSNPDQAETLGKQIQHFLHNNI
ncbi:hypothetical protein [Thiomicrorhabdus sp. 6S3-12]|uniref:hypothetical protein n=1 Tax=Thiomicrorhabdus sp. 6S3-12 TaxID=2819681 RepID=UPI001AAC938A|nr:hypothetical protein [Thiomicrorhabdus sp. 6S3-12]MBO1923730.1 hypothetical protein [Thiomicrorhabdus sp. 6S3-12]